jgi:threonine dehydratase
MEQLASSGDGSEIWVKREDLSAVKSYKWRGSCNRMATLSADEARCGVVTASAGNHAQGVALAANKLGIKARIYMPRSTPKVKQAAVMHHGGNFVEIHLSGDSYDDAVQAARKDEAETGAIYIHAYDDLLVMAGQGTMADEVVLSGNGPFDAVFLQIGGGGMAAGVGTWLKTYWPNIQVIGVEGVDQASMKASVTAQEIVALNQIDLFCDGTAVKRPGELPFLICQTLLHRIDTVTNEQVSHAIRVLWEELRCIAEPSGAMGLAAVLQNKSEWAGKKVLVILCGANIDFLQLGHVARSLGVMGQANQTLRIKIPERPGAMLALLDHCFSGVNIGDFQYGKSAENEAWPVFSISATNEQQLRSVTEKIDAAGYECQDLTGAVDVAYRAIPLRSDMLSSPLFLRLDFHERAGALHEFLHQHVRDKASICYFNYRQSGERVGRALIGLDFPSSSERDAWMASMPEQGDGFRLCAQLDDATSKRLLGQC